MVDLSDPEDSAKVDRIYEREMELRGERTPETE